VTTPKVLAKQPNNPSKVAKSYMANYAPLVNICHASVCHKVNKRAKNCLTANFTLSIVLSDIAESQIFWANFAIDYIYGANSQFDKNCKG